MKLIFCVAKDSGMMFFGKRQSKDATLNEWIVNHIGPSKLWVSSYTAKMFEGFGNIVVDENYMANAGENDYCFVEDKEYSVDGVSEILLCKWNRAYPGDKFFNIDLKANGFKKTDSVDIVGNSHERITIETYSKV